VIHIQKNLGDRADVHHGFKKTEDRREGASPLDYGDGPDRVQRYVGYACQHDQPERDEYGGIQKA
jgi:hypothetical protein